MLGHLTLAERELIAEERDGRSQRGQLRSCWRRFWIVRRSQLIGVALARNKLHVCCGPVS